MFCPECGKKNQDGLDNCVYCGAALIDNQPPIVQQRVNIPSFGQQAASFIKKFKVIIIVTVCVIALVTAFFVIGSSISDPKRVVDKYVNDLMAGNWEGVYQAIDFEESEFINYETFAACQENNRANYSEIESFHIEELEVEAEAIFDKFYEVNYKTSEDYYPQSFSVKLIKQKERMWLIFPTYKIDMEESIGSLSLELPKEVSAKVDGVELTASEGESEEGTVTYEIESIFIGEHTVELSHPLCEDVSEQIYVYDQGTYFDLDDIGQLKYKQEVIDDLAAKTEENLKTIVNGAIEGKDFDALSLECTSDTYKAGGVEEFYTNIVSELNGEDGTELESVTFNSFEDRSGEVFLSDRYECALRFNYDYVVKHKTLLEDGSEEIESVPSERSSDGRFNLEYTYENQNWVISSIEYYYLYY